MPKRSDKGDELWQNYPYVQRKSAFLQVSGCLPETRKGAGGWARSGHQLRAADRDKLTKADFN